MVMSDINVKLKHNLEDANTLFKILFASIKIGEPASKRKIADVARSAAMVIPETGLFELPTSPTI